MSASGEPKDLNRGQIAPWPISAREPDCLSEIEIAKARTLASRFMEEDPTLSRNWFEQEGVSAGWSPGPTVYIEDHRSIALATEFNAKSFEYRSLVLAGDGDYLIVSQGRDALFERYCRKFVGLGAPEVLEIPDALVLRNRRLAKAALQHQDTMAKFVHAARRYGGMNIIPFLSTGDVWTLGRAIARESGRPVRVTGPPPNLTTRANNKLWYARLVRSLFGDRALPITESAYGLTQAAAKARRLISRGPQVIIKVPSSAGAMGNIVLSSDFLKQKGLSAIRAYIAAKLNAVGWRNQFPLLVGVWEENVVGSPSVQIWVPDPSDGPPGVEALFIQTVSRDIGSFVGAEPALLDDKVESAIKTEAVMIAIMLQHLGYVGRLSLDSIILEDACGDTKIHWIEANARWGGVSIPMTVARRFNPVLTDNHLLIVQHVNRARRFPEIQALKEAGVALATQSAPHGALFLVPPNGNHLNFVIIGQRRIAANQTAKQIIEFLA